METDRKHTTVTASQIPGSGIVVGDTVGGGCGRGGIVESGIAGAGSFDGSARPGLAFDAVEAHAVAGFARVLSGWLVVVRGAAVPAVSIDAAAQAALFAALVLRFAQISRVSQTVSGLAKWARSHEARRHASCPLKLRRSVDGLQRETQLRASLSGMSPAWWI